MMPLSTGNVTARHDRSCYQIPEEIHLMIPSKLAEVLFNTIGWIWE